ncbi:hypothetical protein GQ53DRAFT_837593 [Thozetella sp. PMI_491]|nr:hypothetical protein GQ53DRAFT_837593 [Thozetella sp. PMI_491]
MAIFAHIVVALLLTTIVSADSSCTPSTLTTARTETVTGTSTEAITTTSWLTSLSTTVITSIRWSTTSVDATEAPSKTISSTVTSTLVSIVTATQEYTTSFTVAGETVCVSALRSQGQVVNATSFPTTSTFYINVPSTVSTSTTILYETAAISTSRSITTSTGNILEVATTTTLISVSTEYDFTTFFRSSSLASLSLGTAILTQTLFETTSIPPSGTPAPDNCGEVVVTRVTHVEKTIWRYEKWAAVWVGEELTILHYVVDVYRVIRATLYPLLFITTNITFLMGEYLKYSVVVWVTEVFEVILDC